MERGSEVVDFWNSGLHPITMYRQSQKNEMKTVYKGSVRHLKIKEFDEGLYVQTKDLMDKYNIGSKILGEKIRDAGFEKISCQNKKWVLKEFEEMLKK